MKYIINVIVIILLVALVFWVIDYKQSSSRHFTYPFFAKFVKQAKKYIAAKKHNVSLELAPTKRKKLKIAAEHSLAEYFPELFKDFNFQEWDE